jgi:hypothetical protein
MMRTEKDALKQLENDIRLARQAEPGPELEKKLTDMLAEVKRETAGKPYAAPGRIVRMAWVGAAAAVLLLLAGNTWWLMTNSRRQQAEIAGLSRRMDDLRGIAALSLLKSPLAAERITGASYADGLKNADLEVAAALLATLNNDPNVNVRLSALNTLTGMARLPEVRAGLVLSISRQDSPVLQLAIADAMLALQERTAVPALRGLLKQPGLDPGVRQKLTTTIQTL